MGGAAAKNRSRVTQEPCLNCDAIRYQGCRWCKVHKRAYDAMLYQAEHVRQDGQKGFVEAFHESMAKDSTAAEEISKWCEMNPPEAKYTRKKFIDWAQFTKRYGQRHSTVDRRKNEPMIEKEFTLWAENIKGLTPSEAKDWWQEFLDNPAITRDFKGFRGRLQLWIPKFITKENLVETYIDSCQEQGSKASKKLADKDMESLRQHVWRQKTNFGDDYFHS